MNLSPIHNFYHAQLTGAAIASVDSYTVLLAHFDGTANSKTFTDSSSYAKGMTGFNSAHISSTQSQFGGTSLFLNGTGGTINVIGSRDFVSLSDSSDWDFGTNSFTIDFWGRIADNGTFRTPIGQWQNSNTWGGVCVVGASTPVNGSLIVGHLTGGSWNYNISCTHSVGANTWAHYAVVRIDNQNSANSWRLYVNGVSKTLSLGAGSYNGSSVNYAAPLYLGTLLGNFGLDWKGYIDEMRVSKGIARWTAATFSVPTSPY